MSIDKDRSPIQVFEVVCPGHKFPIRKIPNPKGEVLRYIKSGDEISVYSKTVSSYYWLSDETVQTLFLYC